MELEFDFDMKELLITIDREPIRAQTWESPEEGGEITFKSIQEEVYYPVRGTYDWQPVSDSDFDFLTHDEEFLDKVDQEIPSPHEAYEDHKMAEAEERRNFWRER